MSGSPARPEDAEAVREYLASPSPWPPQVLTDAHRALDSALETAIAEYARFGLSNAEIAETISEAVFQAWFYLPDDDEEDQV